MTGRCTRGKIRDLCSANTDCDLPPATCRAIVNWADTGDLSLTYARIRRTTVAGFTPATPGCSRKVDFPLAARGTTSLKLLASGTIDGRVRRDRDTIRYRP